MLLTPHNRTLFTLCAVKLWGKKYIKNLYKIAPILFDEEEYNEIMKSDYVPEDPDFSATIQVKKYK